MLREKSGQRCIGAMGEISDIGCEPRSNAVRLLKRRTAETDRRRRLIYDARGNGDGRTSPTITGDHQNRITDYTAIILEIED